MFLARASGGLLASWGVGGVEVVVYGGGGVCVLGGSTHMLLNFSECRVIALPLTPLELGSIFHLFLYHICVSVIETFYERSDLGNYTTLEPSFSETRHFILMPS